MNIWVQLCEEFLTETLNKLPKLFFGIILQTLLQEFREEIFKNFFREISGTTEVFLNDSLRNMKSLQKSYEGFEEIRARNPLKVSTIFKPLFQVFFLWIFPNNYIGVPSSFNNFRKKFSIFFLKNFKNCSFTNSFKFFFRVFPKLFSNRSIKEILPRISTELPPKFPQKFLQKILGKIFQWLLKNSIIGS